MSVGRRRWKDAQGKSHMAWVVDFVFKHKDGRKERVKENSPVNTRAGAEEFERQLRQTMLERDGRGETEKLAVPTLEEFKERFLTYARNNNKPSQVYAKEGVLRNHLLPHFGQVAIDQILLEEVEQYKAKKLGEKLSPKTVNNHLAMLKKALNLAEEMRLIRYVPKFRMLRAPKSEFRFLDFDETIRFLAAAPSEWKAFLVTALKTGLRTGELLALKWEDLDLFVGRLMVRRTVWNGIEGTPKGGRTREVPLSDEAIAVLKAHRHLKGPYVFCEEDGTRLTHSRLKSIVPRVCARAGLAKRLTTHDLRHTFASHLVMRGVPLAAIKELLGHADITTTMIYAHLSPNMKRDAVRLLDGHPPHGAYAEHGIRA